METIGRLLKIKQAQEITGYSHGKVYGLISGGSLPSIRCGRNIRVPESGLRTWIERNTTGGNMTEAR